MVLQSLGGFRRLKLCVPVVVALGAASACGSAPPSPEATAQTSSAIQGGTSDTSDNFTVAIAVTLSGGQAALCSGILLAPNLVATARHCVSQLSSDQVNCSTSMFGAVYAPSQFVVSNSASLLTLPTRDYVSKIIYPMGTDQTSVCGNDIALLILTQSIQLSQYVTPAIAPPLTDHQTWATTMTAIGYGIDTPTDQAGMSAGVRRIRQNIALSCIPDDPSFSNCYTDTNKQLFAADEFEAGDGTCEGDSGSGAFDQTQFNQGNWVSFGVLSRGGVSTDGMTCTGSIYSRFDAWSQLLVDAANEAATKGGYDPPSWAARKGDGEACATNEECSSKNCVSLDGTNFVCSSACSTSATCTAGASCLGGYCFSSLPPHGGSSGHSGCAVSGPTQPVPWRTSVVLAFVGLAASAVRRRRRGR
jgi:MYXO-CTERM domain-containing protein